jgi:hypothetical protein
VAVKVADVLPDATGLQNLILHGPYPASPDTYPLVRRVYYNSIVGFGADSSIEPHERALGECLANDALMDSTSTSPAHLIVSNGFVLLPLQEGHTTRAYCEEFHEESPPPAGCGAPAPASSACSRNVGGIPTF